MKRPKRSNPVATAPNPVTTLSSPATIVFAYVFVVVGLIFLWVQPSSAQSVTGTTGLFSIPSARTMPDKTVSAGFYFFPGALSSYSRGGLYNNGNFHATLTFLPRLEVMFRYTGMLGESKSTRKIRFMDRMMTARIHILREREIAPSIVLGFQDFGGTVGASVNSYFGTNYVVASKSILFSSGLADISAGYAYDLKNDPSIVMKGFFAGSEFQFSQTPNVSLIVEYDSKRFNSSIKGDFGVFQCLAGLMSMKFFSGGCSAKILL